MFDDKLILSQNYINEHPTIRRQQNLVVLQAEPTAENLLIFMQRTLSPTLPTSIKLVDLKLYETKDSFARWAESAM